MFTVFTSSSEIHLKVQPISPTVLTVPATELHHVTVAATILPDRLATA
jgi:hypothetical protein